MATVNMISPLAEHYRKIEAFFAQDDDVFVIYDNKDRVVSLYVSNPDKADALTEILRDEVIFGNEVVSIRVIPGNKRSEELKKVMKSLEMLSGTEMSVYEKALIGNPALAYIRTIEGVGGMPFNYIVFRNEVVQYFRDDLSDIHRMRSTLYEDIAREIFVEQAGVFFNTALPGDEDK